MDTSILNSIMETVIDWLSSQLIDGVTDETQAGLVRAGQLQDDPTDAQINILIHPGDDDWPDVLNLQDKPPGLHGFTYEIGGNPYGSAAWRRRFMVELSLFFDNENNRDVARTKANVVKSRAHWALMRSPLPQGQDNFGESAHMLQVCNSWIREGGGEGTFIWRGELKFEVFTVMEPE